MTEEKALERLKEVQNLLEGTIDTLDKAYQKAFLVVTRNRPTLDDLPDKHENWLDSPEMQVNLMSSKVRDHIHCAIDQVKKANSDLATAKTIYTLNAKVKKLKAEIETPILEPIIEEDVRLTNISDLFINSTITPYLFKVDIEPSDMEYYVKFDRKYHLTQAYMTIKRIKGALFSLTIQIPKDWQDVDKKYEAFTLEAENLKNLLRKYCTDDKGVIRNPNLLHYINLFIDA